MRRCFDRTPTQKALAHIYALFVEHTIINEIRPNFHKISDDCYRSSQPTIRQLKKRITKYNLKTIISLRGNDENSRIQYLEEKVCKQMGVTFKVIRLYSRDIPKVKELEQIKELCQTSEYPMMFHCKAGADRAGLFATLYLHFIKGIKIQEAVKQLDFFPYGHFKYSKSGVIDFFFANYLLTNNGTDIIEWAKNNDLEAIKKSFKPKQFVSFINDILLKRE